MEVGNIDWGKETHYCDKCGSIIRQGSWTREVIYEITRGVCRECWPDVNGKERLKRVNEAKHHMDAVSDRDNIPDELKQVIDDIYGRNETYPKKNH